MGSRSLEVSFPMFLRPTPFRAGRSCVRQVTFFGRFALLIFYAVLGQAGAVWAGSATIAWNAGSDATLAGYRIHYGTASGRYTSIVDVGKHTSYTIAGLTPGTYYFAVAAYDARRAESPLSLEVSKRIESNTSAAAPAGPVLVFGFEEGTGSTTADSSGNSNAGRLSGTARTTGKFGKSRSFNGTGSFVKAVGTTKAVSSSDSAARRPSSAAGRSSTEERPDDGEAENATPIVDIQLDRSNYNSGDEVTAGVLRISNRGGSERRVEIKTWLVSPAGGTRQIGNFGSEGEFVLAPGAEHDFGPAILVAINDALPEGDYYLNSVLLDAITGELISEDLNPLTIGRSDSVGATIPPAPDTTLLVHSGAPAGARDASSLPSHVVENAGSHPVAVELKIWLQIPGGAPETLVSAGADSSLVVQPGARLTIDSSMLPAIDLSPGVYRLHLKGLDPVTGGVFLERSSPFHVR
jgi:hypothetical protein